MSTITDKAGRVHTRVRTNCITQADRKAVALRQAKALRAAAIERQKKGAVKK